MIDRFATSAGVHKIKPAERAGRKSDLRQLQERISCHNGHGKQAGGDKWWGGGRGEGKALVTENLLTLSTASRLAQN